MSIEDRLAELENFVVTGRVPGTSRCLINADRFLEELRSIKGGLPDDISDAQRVIRQQESILKQAELEARRIRAYADEEATTIRETAEEKAKATVEAAEQRVNKMLEATEVVKAADTRAEEIIAKAEAAGQQKLAQIDGRIQKIEDEATQEADRRKQGADEYAREVLFNLEESVAEVLGQVRKGIDILDSKNGRASAGAFRNGASSNGRGS